MFRIPEDRDYFHRATWGDDNGASHLRAALLKPSPAIPFKGGKLLTFPHALVTLRIGSLTHAVTVRSSRKKQGRDPGADVSGD